MTLQEFINNLNEFVKENPECLTMDVVTSSDDEGNNYNSVNYKPTKGIYEDGEFISFEMCEDYNRDERDINSVCIN